MTQLFDTETYEDTNEAHDGPDAPRHLRSMPTGGELDVAERTTQWRLDDRTIETGRKGILAARAALQDAAKNNTGTTVIKGTKVRRKAA